MTTVRIRRAYLGQHPGEVIELDDAEARRLIELRHATLVVSCPFLGAPYFRDEWWPAFQAAGIVTVADLAASDPAVIDALPPKHIGRKRSMGLVNWAIAQQEGNA